MLGRFFQSNSPATTHIVNPSTQSSVSSQDCEQHLDAYTNFVEGMTTDFDSEDDANNYYDPTVASPKITMNNELSHTVSSNSSSSANESQTNLPAYSAPTRKPTKEFTFPQKPSAAAISHRRRGGVSGIAASIFSEHHHSGEVSRCPILWSRILANKKQ
jgi:hypothetical protein